MTDTGKMQILLADDDSSIYGAELLHYLEVVPGANLTCAITPDDTLRLVARSTFDLILLDINFNGSTDTGLSILPKIRAIQPAAKIVMFSSMDDEKTLVRAVELGATDFISKSSLSMNAVVEYAKACLGSEDLKTRDESTGLLIAKSQGVEFKSLPIREVYRQVACAQRSSGDPVLILGETGVGKDVIASAIAKKGRPFVSIDCGAIQEGLAESIFFGHEKGSFTGADSQSLGLFKQADGGDLFLDEIGNLKPNIQEKLLRAIQTQEIVSLGGKPVRVNVRIIAATNEDLLAAIADGRFRQDLFERINGIQIKIPPLRDRMEDFEGIVASLLRQISEHPVILNPTCMTILRSYDWPGNVRELKSVLASMYRSSGSEVLSLQNLPSELARKIYDKILNENKPAALASETYHIQKTNDLKAAERDFRGQFIRDVYKRMPEGSSKTELAALLGITRHTLAGYLEEMDDKAASIGLEVKRKSEVESYG